MAWYRIHFLSGDGKVQGKDDFEVGGHRRLQSAGVPVSALQREERRFCDSPWRIAQSRPLLARIDELRADRRAPATISCVL